MDLLAKVVSVRKSEAATAWLMFTYSFLAMTSYNIVKPVTQSKFIDGLGAVYVPMAELAAGIIIGMVMQAHMRATGRLPRRAIIPVTTAALMGLLVVFWVLFQFGTESVAVALYIFGRLFGILVISQFWTLANELYDARQARRLFGFIGGGSSLGGMLGGLITAFTAGTVGGTNLLLVSATVLGLCLAIVVVILRRQPDASGAGAAEAEVGVGAQEALHLLRSSKHLKLIAVVIGFAAIGSTVIGQQLFMAAEANRATEGDLTSFLGQITAYLSGIGFLVQVGLTSRIHRSLGLTFALLLLPVSLGATGIVILLNGALWAAGVARVLDTSLRYTIDKTTREVLFLPLPADLRARAKPFVDVTVDRLGKAIGSLLLLVLIMPWGLALDWVTLSYASLTMMALWIGFALVARREYLRTFRKSLVSREMTPGSMRLDVGDPATIEALVEGLSSRDETSVLYAIDMLETLDKRNLVTPLLLYHDSARVRQRVVTVLAAAGDARARSWRPLIERLLVDSHCEVRAAAVRALAAMEDAQSSALLHRFLDDVEPRVVLTAAAELADSDQPDDVAAADEAFTRLIGDARTSAAPVRRDAAAALSGVRNPAFRTQLITLIDDPDVRVAEEAIASARALGSCDALFLPALVSRLGHRTLKAAARETLLSYGEDIVPFLAHALLDTQEQVWVRRHIPATLAHIPSQRALDALTAAAGDPDGFLRYKILTAVETLVRHLPDSRIPPDAVERVIVRETARYYTYFTLRASVVEADAAARGSLLVTALDDKLGRTRDRIFRLLGLVLPWHDMAAARYSLERGKSRTRAGALEYLDNTLGGTIRKRVMPILDEAPVAEKVRQFNGLLKSRPRGLVDTLAQLIHEDDRVVAASAIHFAGERDLEAALSDDLDYVASRRVRDGFVHGAVTWVRHEGRDDPSDSRGGLPIVEVANRLRVIPLFSFVTVDELFRTASAARQVHYERDSRLYLEDAPCTDVFFLLDGRVLVSGGGQSPAPVLAPSALNLADLLEGRPLRHTVESVVPVLGLTLDASDFLAMLSDNPGAAQGLFRMLLGSGGAGDVVLAPGEPGRRPTDDIRGSLDAVETAAILRRMPLFGRASIEEIRSLVAVVQEVRLAGGSVILDTGTPPALYHVLEGTIRLEPDEGPPVTAAAGSTIGIAETLTRMPVGRRVVAAGPVWALRIDPDELFDVLTDHSDLLQSVFSSVIRGPAAEARRH
ncbi:MAG TPA: Npt1/Npt2 family nucleotide transporter [Vicinamibacterales bacterium]|nr:Npt1/Npt2 family nucleotide transporter [Vicinamibacterales bacterium]